MDHTLAGQRRKILDSARALARSGEHVDHHSIAAALQYLDGFADGQRWFEDARFRLQLNTLCARARETPSARRA